MGSRAVAVVCRDADVARKRFGVTTGEAGVIYTRTGRRFFHDRAVELAFLDRLRQAATKAAWWETFQTDWFCLDAELMPWSAKAQELLQKQYGAVGAAGSASLPVAIDALEKAIQRMEVPGEGAAVLALQKTRWTNLERYIAAYRGYCWPVHAVDDLTLAPFHLLATEGKAHLEQNHVWHMETLKGLCEQDPVLLLATPYRIVELGNESEEGEAIQWWTDLTGQGGEGMVVKPFDFLTKGSKGGLIQPAVKCRGREYLRIIYGPDYDLPENIARLRRRGVGAKRVLADREFVLGAEALERFVSLEPLRRVHECVFGVLALETEPIDPRL